MPPLRTRTPLRPRSAEPRKPDARAAAPAGAAARSRRRAPATAGTTDRRRLLAALESAGDGVSLAVGEHEIAVTSLDRVYWPAERAFDQGPITKRDFLRYLVLAADAMLPHLEDRPLTLFRWPTGVSGRRVLMKHWEITLPPFVERVMIFSDAKGHADQYILCNNLATLLWLAHLGTLEFHAWHSRVRPGPDGPVVATDFDASTAALQRSIVNYPDYILFDLDPFVYSGNETWAKQPDLTRAGFAKVKDVARSLERLLTDAGLQSMVKTSGKSGLHVVVPIRRTVTYEVARELSRLVARHLHAKHPGVITLEWAVDKRAGKVFLDYNMNVRGKSMTAPYSPRGLPGAPISMPIGWGDLDGVYPTDFRLPNVVAHLAQRRDPWHGWLGRKQAIEERLLHAG